MHTDSRPMALRVTALLATAMLVAACSGGDDTPSAVIGGPVTTTVDSSTSTTAPSGTTTAPSATTAPATSTTAPTTSTTTTLAPTTTSSTTSTTTSSTTTTTDPPVPAVPADPSLSEWVGVEEGVGEMTGDGVNCLPFYDELGLVDDQACGPWDSADGTHVWTVGTSVSGRWSAAVWRRTGTFSWQPSLRLLEEVPDLWSSVTLIAADVDSGPKEELVVGVRFSGSGGFLSIDVIDSLGGLPTVVAHMPAVEKGSATVAEDLGVWIYEADYGPGDPLCCPSSFVQYLLARAPGGWVIEEGAVGVPPAAVPASQF